MATKKGNSGSNGLTINYRQLGTISIDELLHALIQDVHALRDIYNVQYVKSPRLRLFVTNEYGDEVMVRRPTGGPVTYLDTHHYRPACKDYDL